MIELIIFELHIIGALYVFTKNWQNDSVKEGLLAIIIIGLMFSIGWALTGTLSYAIYPDSWNTIYFNQDSLSLILLIIPELLFFRFYFMKD